MIPRVSIMTNLPQRDATVDNILADELRELGYEVWVTNFLPKNREHILHFKPHILVIPEARCEYTVELARQCMEWGIRVVVRRTEGGAAWDAWDKMGRAEQATVIGAWPYDVDLEIVWSEDFRDLLIKHGYLPAEKVVAVGAMPFDVYLRAPKPQVLRQQKPHLLFAPGWGHADRSPEYNVPEAPFGSPIHRDAWQRHSYGREVWLHMMRRVYQEFGDVFDLFVRPKTGELPIAYQNTLGGRIKVVVPCPTEVALANTDLLIHAGSTMGIEAHLYNIPALSFFGNVNQVPGYEYPHVSPDFEDVDALLKAISKIRFTEQIIKNHDGTVGKVFKAKSNANIKNLKKLEKEFYGTIDGKACKRAAAAIERLPVTDDIEKNIPALWPPAKKEFDAPGVYKHVMTWKCECCGGQCVTEFGRDMIKCPWCGISLARRLEQDKVVIKAS